MFLKILKSFGTFKQFSQNLMSIQETSSSLAKKQLLSKFYNNSSQNERRNIESILKFISQRPKTGIAVRSLSVFLVNKYELQATANQDVQKITDQIARLAQENSEVSLEEVELLLLQMQSKGKGSVLSKLQKIEAALKKMSGVEIKILMRILTKNLRIGLTRTSMDFLKQTRAQSQLSKPLSQDITLMLARPLKNMADLNQFCLKKESDLIADLKYDGERTLIIYDKNSPVQLVSRRHKIQTEIYENLADQIKRELDEIQGIQSAKIDGEIVCTSSDMSPLPMQYLLGVRGKKITEESETRLLVFAFDVIQYNSTDLFHTPLSQRRQMIPQTGTIKLSKSIDIKFPQERQKLFDHFLKVLSDKYEGLIIKGKCDHYYTNGTRKHWAKMKRGFKIDNQDTGNIDLDLVVMGVDYGKGKRSEHFSSFLLGAYHEGELHPITKVGSGFSDQDMADLTSLLKGYIISDPPSAYRIPKLVKVMHYVEPKVVFKINCQDLTRSPQYDLGYKPEYGGISLRFPVFECVRVDKSPQQCDADVLLGLSQDI